MQLSLHADYSLRVLLYLGTHPGEVVTTRDISNAYGISKHHLVRVAQTLGEHRYVELIPGRTGGLRLAMDPSEIRLGDVVLSGEELMNVLFAGLVIGALHLFISRTKLGWAMQAVAQNRTLAAVLGINVSRLVTVTFVLNAALTAVATGRGAFLDIGLGVALINFASTCAFATFLERKRGDR